MKDGCVTYFTAKTMSFMQVDVSVRGSIVGGCGVSRKLVLADVSVMFMLS